VPLLSLIIFGFLENTRHQTLEPAVVSWI